VVGAAVVVDRERDRGVLVVLPEADLRLAGRGRPGDLGRIETRRPGLAERAEPGFRGGRRERENGEEGENAFLV